MKKKTKILSILLIVLLVGLVIGANVWRNHSTVRDVRVDIDYQEGDTLVGADEVKALIAESMPALFATRVSDVDLAAVEKAAARSPYLTDCQAGTSIGGAVVLYAVQRRPIVRVMVGSTEYYLSTTCHKMPVSKTGNSNVIVAGGVIPEKGNGVKDVWTLAKYLDEHRDYGVFFDQIYRNAKGDLYLTPKIGSHIVEVGKPENLDEKFSNLLVFYTQGLPQAGWDTYSQVSIKYRGQVVGTRRN